MVLSPVTFPTSAPYPHPALVPCLHPVPPSEPGPWDLGLSLSLSAEGAGQAFVTPVPAGMDPGYGWREPRWLRSTNQGTSVVSAGVEMELWRDTLSTHGVSSPAGQGRALSLKESPVGTKISSLMSPASGSGWGWGCWRSCSPGWHQVLPAGVACEASAQLLETFCTFSRGETRPGRRAPVPVSQCRAM